jgi:hypothetical protein
MDRHERQGGANSRVLAERSQIVQFFQCAIKAGDDEAHRTTTGDRPAISSAEDRWKQTLGMRQQLSQRWHRVGRMALPLPLIQRNEEHQCTATPQEENSLTGCSRLAGPAAGGAHDDVETDALEKIRCCKSNDFAHTEIKPASHHDAFHKGRESIICNSSPMLFYQIRWPSYAKDFSGCGLAARWDHRRSIPGPPIRPASNRRRP